MQGLQRYRSFTNNRSHDSTGYAKCKQHKTRLACLGFSGMYRLYTPRSKIIPVFLKQSHILYSQRSKTMKSLVRLMLAWCQYCISATRKRPYKLSKLFVVALDKYVYADVCAHTHMSVYFLKSIIKRLK